MNQLEQEKKLVAEFMGWSVFEMPVETKSTGIKHEIIIIEPHNVYLDKTGYNLMRVSDFNPQTDRNAWPEIWDKMNWRMIKEYDKNLVQMHYDNAHPTATGGFGEDTELALRWKSHRAKPEVCWQALIKTLEGES